MKRGRNCGREDRGRCRLDMAFGSEGLRAELKVGGFDKACDAKVSSAEAGLFCWESGVLLGGLICQQSDESGGSDDAR